MSKPGGGQSSGISLGDALRLPKRHPAWRRREAQSGSGTERENLHGDAKGTSTSAPTARPKVPIRRLGADCLVVAWKRGNARRAKGGRSSPLDRVDRCWVNRQREEPDIKRKAAAFAR